MLSSRDTKIPKITHIPRRMLEFPGFSNVNISRREHSVELKFLGYSTYKQKMPAAKSQLGIPSFDLLVYTTPEAKISVKCL
jgi:hypothetical protein